MGGVVSEVSLVVEVELVLLWSMVLSSVVLFEVILVVVEGDVALEVSSLVAEVELVMSLVVSVGAGLEVIALIVVVEVVLLGASVTTSEVSSGRAFSEEVMSASCALTTTAPFAINRRPAINASVKRLGDMLPPR